MAKDQMHAQVVKALKRAAPIVEREKDMQAKELGFTYNFGLKLRPKTTELAAAIAVNKADQW